MKKKFLSVLLALVLVLSFSSVAFAAKPTTFTVDHNQAQLQWRAWSPLPSGTWSPLYLTRAETSEFKLTGNVLHSAYEYSPDVDDLEGESTVYVYNKGEELWIEKEGTVSYKYAPFYGDYPIVNYWRGYLNFGGNTPSEENFVNGVAYQWAYIYAPSDEDLTAVGNKGLEYAQWDPIMGAWLVGFSVYLWDPDTPSPSIEFPNPIPAPVPARNFNPLDL